MKNLSRKTELLSYWDQMDEEKRQSLIQVAESMAGMCSQIRDKRQRGAQLSALEIAYETKPIEIRGNATCTREKAQNTTIRQMM